MFQWSQDSRYLDPCTGRSPCRSSGFAFLFNRRFHIGRKFDAEGFVRAVNRCGNPTLTIENTIIGEDDTWGAANRKSRMPGSADRVMSLDEGKGVFHGAISGAEAEGGQGLAECDDLAFDVAGMWRGRWCGARDCSSSTLAKLRAGRPDSTAPSRWHPSSLFYPGKAPTLLAATMTKTWGTLHSSQRDREDSRFRPRRGRVRWWLGSGLRMMPTFPPPPLSFRTAGFPQYGWKVGLSGSAFPPCCSA
jgi:hypothetical protein